MTWILPKQLHTLVSALGTEALISDSEEQSKVCAQSLFLRSKVTPLQTWSRKWKRDSWTQHLSGRILRPSLGQRFATEWTSSLAATHANPSVQQASDLEGTTRDISGHTSQEEFAFSSQEYASLKTSKDIFHWGCPTLSKTWQEWVTEQRGAYSQRLKLAHLINASGCLLWPTISVNESKNSIGGSQMERNSIPLGTMAAMHGPPAPASSSTDGSRPESWATPTARDHKSGKGKEDRTYSELTPMIERQAAGRLNPRWVETLMGLPVGWTMPSCQSPVTIVPTNSDSLATESSQPPQPELF
jgi:hypothetical protein